MSRRRFCIGASAGATQLVFGNLFDEPSKQTPKEWKFSLREAKGQNAVQVGSNYGKEEYLRDVKNAGLAETWNEICRWMLENGDGANSFLAIRNFGELYEEGLAVRDKNDKKSSGQYYTPPDVSRIMAMWFSKLPGNAICDVACGVGNLILTYLDMVGEAEARRLLGNGHLYLYDNDEVAVRICVTSILVKYGIAYADKIHVLCHDFLDATLQLPPGCKVISNPPYAAIKDIPSRWPRSDVILSTKELYASFMEKILTQSRAAVIITPYSFIGGAKFYPLRCVMNEVNGFVVSFDNVPGAIFSGRKHGIFNSNTGNSVRAAITVVENKAHGKGFRFSPLIRFKSVERTRLLECKRLESFVGSKSQIVSKDAPMFAKCDNRLEHIFEAWRAKSNGKVADLISPNGEFLFNMPNTCRYFTVATQSALSRKGQMSLRFADEDAYWYVMGMVNSSFAYWHWRLYDGGITYPSGLLFQMPVFIGVMSRNDLEFLKRIGKEMNAKSSSFIITKANVGIQENIKFPRAYRDQLNRCFLDALGVNDRETVFDIVHSNMALEVNA